MLGILLTGLAFALFIDRRYVLSLLIFFGLVTNGYQLIPPDVLLAGAPVDKTTDLALLFLLVTLVSRGRVLWLTLRRERVFRWVGLFVAFIAVDAVYSVWATGYELGGVLRVFRVNLFLLSFGIFFVVPTPALQRTFHALAVLTVIQSVIFLLQIPLGETLLSSSMAGSDVSMTQVDKFAFTRFYNTPAFLTPVLFYYLFQFRCRTRLVHLLVLGVLLLTVLAPLHRNYIVGIAVTVGAYLIFQQERSKRIIYVGLLALVGYGVTLIDVVSYRLEEGVTDFNSTFAGGGSLATTDYGSNTFAYRMAHLAERINYITEKPVGYVFGIGLLSEDAKQAQRLTFEVGAHDKRTGQVTQINTGDIAWSLLVLQLGFVGTLLFVIVMVQFSRLFYRFRSVPLGAVGLLTVATTLIISFAGTELLMIPFRTLLVLLAVAVTKAAHLPPPIPVADARTGPTIPVAVGDENELVLTA